MSTTARCDSFIRCMGRETIPIYLIIRQLVLLLLLHLRRTVKQPKGTEGRMS
jgi:hypothetical protein